LRKEKKRKEKTNQVRTIAIPSPVQIQLNIGIEHILKSETNRENSKQKNNPIDYTASN
jgi:hypothetical protein